MFEVFSIFYTIALAYLCYVFTDSILGAVGIYIVIQVIEAILMFLLGIILFGDLAKLLEGWQKEGQSSEMVSRLWIFIGLSILILLVVPAIVFFILHLNRSKSTVTVSEAVAQAGGALRKLLKKLR